VAAVSDQDPQGPDTSSRAQTDLDRAVEAAREDPERRAAFYDVFLRAELFIPTRETPEEDAQAGDAAEDPSFTPLLVESDGVPYLLLFDSLKRLHSWAEREIGYIRVPGHTLVEVMDPRLHWILNLGTSFTKEFVSDEITWLQQILKRERVERREVPAGTKILVGAPKKEPEALAKALQPILERHMEVRDAHLAQVHYDLEGERPHLALAASLDVDDEELQGSIRREVAIAARPFLKPGQEIDIHLDDGPLARKIMEVVDPFYHRDA
jgi:hypothetical protein